MCGVKIARSAAEAADRELDVEADEDLEGRNAVARAQHGVLRFDEGVDDAAIRQGEDAPQSQPDRHDRRVLHEIERGDATRAQVIAVAEIVEEQRLGIDQLGAAVEGLLVGEQAGGESPIVLRARDGLDPALPLAVAQRPAGRCRCHEQRAHAFGVSGSLPSFWTLLPGERVCAPAAQDTATSSAASSAFPILKAIARRRAVGKRKRPGVPGRFCAWRVRASPYWTTISTRRFCGSRTLSPVGTSSCVSPLPMTVIACAGTPSRTSASLTALARRRDSAML